MTSDKTSRDVASPWNREPLSSVGSFLGNPILGNYDFLSTAEKGSPSLGVLYGSRSWKVWQPGHRN